MENLLHRKTHTCRFENFHQYCVLIQIFNNKRFFILWMYQFQVAIHEKESMFPHKATFVVDESVPRFLQRSRQIYPHDAHVVQQVSVGRMLLLDLENSIVQVSSIWLKNKRINHKAMNLVTAKNKIYPFKPLYNIFHLEIQPFPIVL